VTTAFRSWQFRVPNLVAFSVLAIVGFAMLATPGEPSARILGAIILGSAALMLWRVARSGAVLNGPRLVCRGVGNSASIATADVAAVEVSRIGLLVPWHVIVIRTVADREVVLRQLAWVQRSRAVNRCDAMQRSIRV
jgi:hypothetical protein